jgi:hypothetical protein
MKNADELLKRILLNMKYDSRKTLVENKEYIFEANVIPVNTPLTQGIVGNVRSEKYPELGKWGDGNCKCSYTDKLVFDKSCCKTPTITVGPTEFLGNIDDTIDNDNKGKNVIDYYGNPLTLPPGTTEIRTFTKWDPSIGGLMSDPKLASKTFPKFMELCQSISAPNINKCITDTATSFINKLSEGGVTSFKNGGRFYRGCYPVKKSGTFLNPNDIKIENYVGSLPNEITPKDMYSGCVGVIWGEVSQDKSDLKNKQGKAYSTGEGEAYDSNAGGELMLGLDL